MRNLRNLYLKHAGGAVAYSKPDYARLGIQGRDYPACYYLELANAMESSLQERNK